MRIKKPKTPLCDAQARHRLYSATFDVPDRFDLRALEVGDLVKVATGGERFWLQIVAVRGTHYVGRVDNTLVCTRDHGLSFDDHISFERRHVLQISHPRKKTP